MPERNKEEDEKEQEQDKCQLSSSVIIEVPNVQSSLELSTITGIGTTVGLWVSGADKVTFFMVTLVGALLIYLFFHDL